MASIPSYPIPSDRVEEPTIIPWPPRYWWFKRIALGIIVLAVGMALLRVWWGFEASRRLEQQVAQYRAAGQPVHLKDFEAAPIPTEQNAAHWLVEAANAMVGGTISIDDAYGNAFFWRSRSDDIHNLVAANSTSLDLVRRARTCEGCDWRLPVGNNRTVSTQIWAVMSSQRQLAKMVDVSGVTKYLAGDRVGALESLRDLQFMSRMMRIHPTATSQTMANNIDRMVCTRVQRLAGAFLVEANIEDAAADQETVMASIRSIQGELLDETDRTNRLLQAGYGERAIVLDSFSSALGSTKTTTMTDRFLAPMRELRKVQEVRRATDVAQASISSHWHDAETKFPREEKYLADNRSLRWVFGEPQDAPRSRLRSVFSLNAQRRMAATSLSIHLFRHAHQRWPESLDELFPAFLSEIPDDPFAGAGDKIRYALDGERPRLYSLGPNGVDDGGVQAPFGRGRMEFNEGDIVFFLDGRSSDNDPRSRTVPPPSTQAENDGVDKSGSEGNATENRDKEDAPKKRDE